MTRRSGGRSFWWWWLAIPAALGCVGDPDVGEADLALDAASLAAVAIERPVWEAAPAGCEGVREGGLAVASCEGEPSLAALVDRHGAVLCVDALSLIVLEAHGLSATSWPSAGDPSPQPNRPPPPEARAPK